MIGGAEDRARSLADLATALTAAATDLDSVLETGAQAAATLIGDAGVVRLVAPDGVTMGQTTVAHPDPRVVAQARAILDRPGQPLTQGLSGQVAAGGRVYLENALDTERMLVLLPPGLRPAVADLDIRAMVIAPLIANGRYRGFMATARLASDLPYTAADQDLAADIAARIALAVATAQSMADLAYSEDRYRRIVETSLEGIWEIDRAGITRFANPQMAIMLRTTVADLIGQPAEAWIYEADWVESQRRLTRGLSVEGEKYRSRLRRADGSLLWVQVAATPMFNRAGTDVGMLGMLTDISEGIRREELQQRLEQMQRLDSLGQLAGGIAHDFNNLLSVVSGFTELWRADLPPDSPQADLAAQVIAVVERGAGLTRQLLAFGRGDSGQAEVLDIPTVVSELAPMLHRTLGEHVELIIPVPRPETEPCRALVDRGQLEQLIVNLAINARDAMDAGGRVAIECERVLVDGPEVGREDKAWYVRLAVSDTGSGMDEETRRRAFEPFFTTKRIGKGTGLGLAGVYGIARNAGGTANLYSEVGVGTTVKVYLPASDEPFTVADQAPAAPVADPNMLRVLVVEDAPDLADVIRRLLDKAGHRVTVLLTGVAALAALDEGLEVDLVITDVVMPGMTGPELAREVGRRHPAVRVLFTSGYTAGMLGDRGQLTADAHLVEKPFTKATLLAGVADVMR